MVTSKNYTWRAATFIRFFYKTFWNDSGSDAETLSDHFYRRVRLHYALDVSFSLYLPTSKKTPHLSKSLLRWLYP